MIYWAIKHTTNHPIKYAKTGGFDHNGIILFLAEEEANRVLELSRSLGSFGGKVVKVKVEEIKRDR